MVVHISQAAAISACSTINGKIDAGTSEPGPGHLLIYSGTRPATADTAVTGGETVLIDFTLNATAFGTPADNSAGGAQAAANAIDPVTAEATGTATFFRITDSDGVVIMDGTVTDTTGNGDLKLSTTSVVSGIDVSVVSLNAIMPYGN